MQKLRIFNPEHDLALAFGGTNYTPPPMARILRRDLQLLPIWFSQSGDSVLSQNSDTDCEWLNCINTQYQLGINVASVNDVAQYDAFAPWGWNKYIRRRLFLDGANENHLPTETQIDTIRDLSHRRISIEIHRRFLALVPSLRDITPVECFSLDEVLRFVKSHPVAYTKAPWSSSGKGIYRAIEPDGLDFTRWVSGIIKRQGSIMCEKPLKAVLDFAMEFECANGQTQFIGYSVFNNDTHSSYSGGMVACSDFLHKKITDTLGNENLINDIRSAAIKIIDTLIAPHYTGYLGLDMMIYLDADNTLQVNPCIELNLRTTMGVVSSIIGNRIVAPHSHGIFNVEFHKSIISADYVAELERNNPLKFSNDGKIISGTQFLAPLYDDSQYCAYIQIFESSL